MRIAVLTIICLCLAACGRQNESSSPILGPLAADEITARTLTDGSTTIGGVTPDGAHAWLGLPYAAPPVGDLRWRAPRPLANEPGSPTDPREALAHPVRCTQMTNGYDQVEGVAPGEIMGEEDCLYLSIYAPPMTAEEAAAARLPVMVWVHGGGNVWGRTETYDLSRLAVNENVVLVAVQFRLGPFGWFAHEALREDTQNDRDRAANFALLDIVASLEWARDNIASFGGAADNVTLFGESSGGHNIAGLLASPLAEGLFHQAIIQSGAFDSLSPADAENGESVNAAARIAERLGAENAADLRAATTKAVFGAYEQFGGGFYEVPIMIEDGVSIPDFPLKRAFEVPGAFAALPVISGVNRDEARLFQVADPNLVQTLFGAPLWPRDRDYYEAAADYQSRLWRLRSVDQPLAGMTAAGHKDVYAYRFDWDEGGRFLFIDLSVLLGAAHALEMPFVFNRFVLTGAFDSTLFTKKTAPAREKLSRAMGAYWAAFARNGAPAVAGQPPWPRWGENGGTIMILDDADGGGVRPATDVETLDRILADLKADARLDADERCDIANALSTWAPDFVAPFRDALSCEALPSP